MSAVTPVPGPSSVPGPSVPGSSTGHGAPGPVTGPGGPAPTSGTRPLDVVVVNGSPHANSRTAALAALVTTRLGELVDIAEHRVDVYGLGAGLTSAVTREDVSAPVEAELRRIEAADVIVVAVPVFRGSYPGMFKHLFDLVGQYALANTLVVLTATGGSPRHAMVIDHELRPLFAFFQALVAPVGYFVCSADFDGTVVLDSEVYSRIEVGLADVVGILRERARVAPERLAG